MDCHTSLLTFFEYWDARRVTRLMPARTDIDPVDIKALLPVPDPDRRRSGSHRCVYRLVGTREVEVRGADLTGKPVTQACYGEIPRTPCRCPATARP